MRVSWGGKEENKSNWLECYEEIWGLVWHSVGKNQALVWNNMRVSVFPFLIQTWRASMEAHAPPNIENISDNARFGWSSCFPIFQCRLEALSCRCCLFYQLKGRWAKNRAMPCVSLSSWAVSRSDTIMPSLVLLWNGQMPRKAVWLCQCHSFSRTFWHPVFAPSSLFFLQLRSSAENMHVKLLLIFLHMLWPFSLDKTKCPFSN